MASGQTRAACATVPTAGPTQCCPGGGCRALGLLRVELPGWIAAWAQRVTPGEPVACVALQYDGVLSS